MKPCSECGAALINRVKQCEQCGAAQGEMRVNSAIPADAASSEPRSEPEDPFWKFCYAAALISLLCCGLVGFHFEGPFGLLGGIILPIMLWWTMLRIVL